MIFGDENYTTNTHRIGMNYVKAKVVGNSKNLYIPVKMAQLQFCQWCRDEEALGFERY